jgi:hypothetical protein
MRRPRRSGAEPALAPDALIALASSRNPVRLVETEQQPQSATRGMIVAVRRRQDHADPKRRRRERERGRGS